MIRLIENQINTIYYENLNLKKILTVLPQMSYCGLRATTGPIFIPRLLGDIFGAAGRGNVARNPSRGARIFRSASELESESINQLDNTACHQRTGLDKNEKINDDKDVRH